MKTFNANDLLKVGDEIYAPKTNEYFRILQISFVAIYNDVLVFVEPTIRNPESIRFSFRLSAFFAIWLYCGH